MRLRCSGSDLRFIHSGVREKVDLCLLKAADAQTLLQREEQDPAAFHARSVPMYEIAADGLAYGFKWRRKHVDLYPGYRSDLLVRIDEPGDYVLLDLHAPADRSLHQEFETPKLLAVVPVDRSMGQGIRMPLPPDAALEKLRPHRSITDEEVKQRGPGGPRLRLQRLKFQIETDSEPEQYKAGDPQDPEHFKPFGENGIRTLELGKADEWHLTAQVGDHPFHIHVNPFEVLEHPWLTGAEQPTDERGEARTIWKDTVMVPNGGDVVRIRSRYERYIGRFVLHCHILDHEDHGMMQLVEIVGPGSAGHGGHADH